MAGKPKTEKKKEQAPKQEEKVLVIPLRKEYRKSPKNMRKNRSVREIKAFLSRHMKTTPSNVRISQQLNESLWKGGLHNNQAGIKLKVSSDEEGKVLARLMDEKEKPKSQKKSRLGLRERLAGRRESAAEEKKELEKPAAEKKEPGPKKERAEEAEQGMLPEQ
jgi:large subunit ribosomal protein L31e